MLSTAEQISVRSQIVSAGRPNTLGLGPRELGVLLDMLDASDGDRKSPRREFARSAFRESGVIVHVQHPGGTAATLKLAARNLSRGGAALLHNGFIHPGTKCRIELPRVNRSPVEVTAIVARCQHRRGSLHEIGVKFDKPVNMRRFVSPSSGEQFVSIEHVDPARLTGRMLQIGDSPLDVKIIAHFLRETPMKIEVVRSGAAALARAGEAWDVMLVDEKLSDMSGLDAVRGLRAAGLATPAVVITTDPVGLMTQGLWEVPATGLIKHPFTQAGLLRVLGERILIKDEGDDDGAPLTKAGGALADLADKLEAVMTADDAATAVQLCGELVDLAAAAGKMPLARAAEATRVVVEHARCSAEAKVTVGQIVRACRAVSRG